MSKRQLDALEESPIKRPRSTSVESEIIQVERSSLDSYHDNPSSRNHPIIKELYRRDLRKFTNEDVFVTYVDKDVTIPKEYFENRDARKEARVNGFFAPTMECLVDGNPYKFPEVDNKEITFVYDQGPHPVNYFKDSINGIFISDAVDTAPKKTDPSQRPVLFETGEISLSGHEIGFNENIVRTVIFTDFKIVDNQVGCKVIIEANVNFQPETQPQFKWYDLAQNFNTDLKSIIGHNNRQQAIENANYKKSNDRDIGFFIGNVKAKVILEDLELKPILALCLVVAKVLGDFSSALAASPIRVDGYKTLRSMYSANVTLEIPRMFIHASGDRLCSLEAIRQGGHVIQTFPRNKDGVIPFQYTPGSRTLIPIDYPKAFDKIRSEITSRFDALIKDVEDFKVSKYKVDGNIIDSTDTTKTTNLKKYSEEILTKIRFGKSVIETYIQSISGLDDKEKYEILRHQKISLMPQSPFISTPTIHGIRKNLNVLFNIYKLPDSYTLPQGTTKNLSLYPKAHVYNIMRRQGGSRRRTIRGGVWPFTSPVTPPSTPPKPSSLGNSPNTVFIPRSVKRNIPIANSQRTVRNIRFFGSIMPKKSIDVTEPIEIPEDTFEEPKHKDLKQFNQLIEEVREKVYKYALDPCDIQFDSKIEDDPIRKFILKIGSVDSFIENVKQNRRNVRISIKDGKNTKSVTIHDYDEEFMKEFEEIAKEIKEENEIVDPAFINMIKTLNTDSSDSVTPPNTPIGGRKRKTPRRLRLF
jgi:hypothetical protein